MDTETRIETINCDYADDKHGSSECYGTFERTRWNGKNDHICDACCIELGVDIRTGRCAY